MLYEVITSNPPQKLFNLLYFKILSEMYPELVFKRIIVTNVASISPRFFKLNITEISVLIPRFKKNNGMNIL